MSAPSTISAPERPGGRALHAVETLMQARQRPYGCSLVRPRRARLAWALASCVRQRPLVARVPSSERAFDIIPSGMHKAYLSKACTAMQYKAANDAVFSRFRPRSLEAFSSSRFSESLDSGSAFCPRETALPHHLPWVFIYSIKHSFVFLNTQPVNEIHSAPTALNTYLGNAILI